MSKLLVSKNKISTMKSLIAYQRIRDLIIRGVKLPGTRLVIADLENELGIGRGAIREALMRLDRSGLVINQPYRGTIVATPPQIIEIECMYNLRLNLELFLSREAMYRLQPKDFDKLELFITMFKNIDNEEHTFFSLDRKFHSYSMQYS